MTPPYFTKLLSQQANFLHQPKRGIIYSNSFRGKLDSTLRVRFYHNLREASITSYAKTI
ncbi:hypothetical protein SESBI_26709 [Sesbania bispinosa]|nr:hypothetical protein SESBI_26709 [Sesbania bispinosa]